MCLSSLRSFVWQLKNHSKFFDEMKSSLASIELLAYYDVRKSVTAWYFNSQAVKAAILLKDDRPVEYASHALSSTEQSCVWMEK